MNTLLNTIISIIVAFSISGGVAGMSEVDPAEATQDFINGISSGNQQITASYMDNQYVNFLENVKGSDEEMDRLETALFKNLDYKIAETAVKGNVAVAKVEVTTNDFSGVMDDYEKESYKYVMDNLYDSKVTDKAQLNKKCMDIYLDQVEETAKDGKTVKKEIFIPMEDNGYYGWKILLNDEIMKTLVGGLELPDSK